jgi:hypothetical protein
MRQDIFPIFFVVWVALGIAGFFLFYVSKNVQFKKRYFPWYVILAGVLFISFGLGTGLPLEMLYFMVPVVALITFLNIRSTKFCDNCGRTIINQAWFSKVEYCAKCGAKLNS